MINTILQNQDLSNLQVNVIEENGATVSLCKSFYSANNKLDTTKIINLSVDTYYNSLNLPVTPPSIDNLVLISRGNNSFSFYLIELKHVSRMKSLKIQNIKAKFDTVIRDFLKERFKNEFDTQPIKLIDLNIWLVCNRFNFLDLDIPEEDYKKKVESTFIEQLLLVKPYRYKNKVSGITPMHNNCSID